MTESEQLIVIAEFCGYKRVECPPSSLGGESPHEPKPMTYWKEECWGDDVIGIPDYLHDLNAMHEAELHLTTYLRSGWSQWIYQLCQASGGHCWSNAGFATILLSNAAQRAEALLRTIGKWKSAT